MKVFPRNLTARAAAVVAGNPANTRLESAVANCFPGLEFDVRALDPRFFPGLRFRCVTIPGAPPVAPPVGMGTQGFRLLYLDYLEDPMLPKTSVEPWVVKLLQDYLGPVGTLLNNGKWYLDAIEQNGHRIEMHDSKTGYWDGETVWFFVRAIAPDVPLTIELVQRDAPPGTFPIVLHGMRRTYVDKAGVIDRAYRAGELTESMCNPWQHDFRDCGCHYWASNHPDVVMGEVAANEALPDGESTNPTRASTYLDWIREDQSDAAAASASNNVFASRPFQIDHFQINRHWERLRFVLEGREIEGTYRPEPSEPAKPYATPEEMIDALEQVLAPMEMTLALEYLYALFSVRSTGDIPADRWPTLRDDVVFVRRFVTLVAVGEMTHMRWGNQMLWELYRHGFFPAGRHYRPIVEPGVRVPASRSGWRTRALRTLTPETLDEFVIGERPGGPLDCAYTRCVATLEAPQYPRHLYQLAVRIDSDGMDHYGKFREVRRVLQSYAGAAPRYPYLREVRVGTPDEARDALARYRAIVDGLKTAYVAESEDRLADAEQAIAGVRAAMDQLLTIAEGLASQGIGIPFWQDVPTTVTA